MNQQDINNLNEKWKNLSTVEILHQSYKIFNDNVAFSSSLGFEDQILTHLIAKHNPKISIFTLDTGRLFPETYDLIDRTNARYGMNIRIFFPDAKQVEDMVNINGVNLFYESIENRKLCCGIRKSNPLNRALTGLDAWITGLRRSQSITRVNMQVVEWDEMHQMVKINPLINWTETEVQNFIKANNIPYNTLHDKGLPSIGCQPCTRAIDVGEDLRAGRWWWELPEQKECGLHKAR
ncbi:MAG: phosphoadenylyl-sulfate reductase [Bacteroidetes bacterium HGW-Bacteroidetes-1]|jgi:phosphoadenosine phosphosulfate reductase|nr:MAG: phosphoadenylyl-sulfate reductase [Bacteroidetes bacterium HGW-Bacteroidetes-1]